MAIMNRNMVLQDTGHRICSFLGLSTSERERKEIRGYIKFDVMKANPMTNLTADPTSVSLDSCVQVSLQIDTLSDSFVSLTVSQHILYNAWDWKDHFNLSQNKQSDQHYKKKIKKTLQGGGLLRKARKGKQSPVKLKLSCLVKNNKYLKKDI